MQTPLRIIKPTVERRRTSQAELSIKQVNYPGPGVKKSARA